MLQRIKDTAAALAAAVTGTATDATDAAGCRFGPDARAGQSRPLPVWNYSVTAADGTCVADGTVEARDRRAAFRAFARRLRTDSPLVCGPDGPAVSVDGVESTTKVLPLIRILRGPDGVECGHVRINRTYADGRPTRRRIGGGR